MSTTHLSATRPHLRAPARVVANLLPLLAFLLHAGCAEIKIVGQDAAPTDTQEPDGDVVGVDAASTDGVDGATNDTTGQDIDAATNPDVAGNECTTPYDCLDKIQGKTPCISAACENGYCVKKQKDVGATCKDSTQSIGECDQLTCDVVGACVSSHVKDGSVCGAGLCGKKCAVGVCVVATDADYEDGDPCTKDYCDQGIKIVHAPVTDLTASCSDGDACTAGDVCLQGTCKGTLVSCSDGIGCTVDTCSAKSGCAHTADAKKCDDANPCTADGCDLAVGCTVTSVNGGLACDDGNECTENDACDAAGACVGGAGASCACVADADCAGKTKNLCIGALVCTAGFCTAVPQNAVYCATDDDTACVQNTCTPLTGTCALQVKNEGAPCDDGNACATGQTCQSGSCLGTGAVNCDDANPCTADLCLPQSGCIHEANGSACDDGNVCTGGDVCKNGSCGGSPTQCDDGVACTFDACDKLSGACTHELGNGGCNDDNPCTTDSCSASAGCEFAANDSATCDDGNPCTANSCKGGSCLGTSICACGQDSDCDDKNPCTKDTCTASACTYQNADGGACSTSDKCQAPDSGVCGGGTCVSGNEPKDCSSLSGACLTGSCNPGTGACDALPKGDGTLCDADGDPCTTDDACTAGTCAAGKSKDCSGLTTACGTGVCKNSEGSAVCATAPADSGLPCEDGDFCTLEEVCDGSGGCGGGVVRTCAEASDACNQGFCDVTGQKCGTTPKGVTVACDDGQFCTIQDHCDAGGLCVGGNVTVCGAPECWIGFCDPATQGCSANPSKSGTACSDGDACTTADECDGAGTCKPGQPVQCPSDACNAGVCSAITGACTLDPSSETTGCDDGQTCTDADHCDGLGKCVGGPWNTTCGCNADAMCDDGNACTADTCDVGAAKCTFATLPDAKCDDGDACTTASTCNTTGSCVATALYDCSSLTDDCHQGTCSAGITGPLCTATVLPDGTACSDGLYCTTGEACKSGSCSGGTPVTCTPAAQCFTSSCDEGQLGCYDTAAAKGSSCSDGETCTLGDSCDGTGVCMPGSPAVNYGVCDDGDTETSGDLCITGVCGGFRPVLASGGPTTRIAYDSTAGAWWFAGAVSPATSVAKADKWGVAPVTMDPKGGWVLNIPPTMNTAPIRALSPVLAGGANNFVAFHVPGETAWTLGDASGLGKEVGSKYTATTEWYATTTRSITSLLSGTTTYALLAGNNSTEYGVLGYCSGSLSASGTWTCNKTALSGYAAAAAFLSTAQACSPICTTTAVAVIGAMKWNLSIVSQLDVITNTGSAWGTLVAGPNLTKTSASLVGGTYAYNTTKTAAPTGTSLVWTVGPSGSVAYQAVGSSTLKGLSLFPSTYNFTDVTVSLGTVLVWGWRLDVTGNPVPLLLTHPDVANTQTTANTWTEHVLSLPGYSVSACPDSAFSSYGMATGGANGKTLALVGNVCANSAYAKPADVRGVVYVRE